MELRTAEFRLFISLLSPEILTPYSKVGRQPSGVPAIQRFCESSPTVQGLSTAVTIIKQSKLEAADLPQWNLNHFYRSSQ